MVEGAVAAVAVTAVAAAVPNELCPQNGSELKT